LSVYSKFLSGAALSLPSITLPLPWALPSVQYPVKPLQLAGIREHCKLPSGSGRVPAAKHFLEHFEVEIAYQSIEYFSSRERL